MLPEIYAREILRGLQRESSGQVPHTRVITISPVSAKKMPRATGSALTRLGQWLESWASHSLVNATPPASAHPVSGYPTRAAAHPGYRNGQCHE